MRTNYVPGDVVMFTEHYAHFIKGQLVTVTKGNSDGFGNEIPFKNIDESYAQIGGHTANHRLLHQVTKLMTKKADRKSYLPEWL